MTHVRRLGALAALVVSLACGGGAGSGGGASPPAGASAAPATLTIAVIPKGTSHVFWQSIHAGAVKAAREVGAEIIWRGPLREDDRDSQVSEVEGFVSRGISGIVLAPLDDMALVGPVSSATRNKIPVVIIDSGLKGGDYVSFVATDNAKGGRLGGEQLAKVLGGKGKVVLLRYAEGSASTNEREDGFLAAMKAAPGVQVVSSNQYGGADVESAYKKSESLLSNYKQPDGRLSIDGIFCPNESTSFAMLRVLQDNGWAGKVHFVGFDASQNLVKGLADGQIDALVVQDPINMGYLGVKTLVAHIKGQPVDKRIDTGVRVATKENMDSPDMKDVLHPDLTQWLKP
ncbi:MAG TPA: substrate-binding domain-containing protein [Vicinamibacteria bacterium]|nr:substrate-binding domain-containing protein [Vicinamibacteria bacterium]